MIFSRTALLFSVAVLTVIVTVVTVVLYVGNPRVPILGRTARPAAAQADGALSRSGAAISELTFSPLEGKATTLSHSLSLPRGFDRTQSIERAAYELFLSSSPAALAQVAKIDDVADRAAFLRGMFTGAAQLAPREALRLIKQLTGETDRELAMQALSAAWRGGLPVSWRGRKVDVHLSQDAVVAMALVDGTTARAEFAIAWAQELVTERRDYAAVLGAAAQSFTATNPRRVQTLFEELSNEDERRVFTRNFVQAWAEIAPLDAWAAVQELPAGELRATVHAQVFEKWGAEDPASAIAAVQTLPAGDERTAGIAAIANAWGARDTRGALDWAATLNEGERATAEGAVRLVAPVGIGAVLDADAGGYPVVRDLLADSPAARSGQMPAGSRIMAIADAAGNPVDTKNMELAKFVEKVRGPRGTRVTVFVQTPGATATTQVELVREQILLKRKE